MAAFGSFLNGLVRNRYVSIFLAARKVFHQHLYSLSSDDPGATKMVIVRRSSVGSS